MGIRLTVDDWNDYYSRAARKFWPLPCDVMKAILAPLDSTAAIVDIGCGQGDMIAMLRSRGFTRVTGIDCSAEAVHRARKANPGADIRVATIDKDPIQACHLAFLHLVLPFVECKKEVLEKVKRAAQSVVITTPVTASRRSGCGLRRSMPESELCELLEEVFLDVRVLHREARGLGVINIVHQLK